MANLLIDPFTSAAGATLAATSGAAQGAAWTASQFAKFGKNLAGAPGELSAAIVGAGTGAMGGFLVGSIIGALSGGNMVRYFIGDLVNDSARKQSDES